MPHCLQSKPVGRTPMKNRVLLSIAALSCLLAIAPARGEGRCAVSPARVVVFTTSWCSLCKSLKRFFAKESVEYAECDIEANAMCAETLFELTHQSGVPVTFVCHEVVFGFNEAVEMRLRDLIGLGN